MNEIERRAMEFLLAGEHPALAVLREQLKGTSVAKRDFTGVGFFTHFAVPESAARLDPPSRMVIGDVYAEVVGLDHPAGFVLFVEGGAIKALECFIHEPALPQPAEVRRIYHVHPAQPGSGTLVETQERDLAWAVRERGR